MRVTMKYSFFLSCIILILLYDTDKTLASAPPVCKFKCRGQSGNLLKLEEGVTYTYNLEGSTDTLLPKSKGPQGESVKLNLKAKVEVATLPQCKTLIQLRDVHVTGPDGKDHHGLVKLEQNPLVVSLHGGKLDSEVCAVHDDDFASLNIKRAVASLLQANTGDHGGNGFEHDVFGGCPTHFKVSKEADVTVVTKHRDLEKCQFRENLRQPFFSSTHGHSADIQSSPLLDSQYEVEQRIKNGILESATVKENYLFRPFSNRENGAKTKVITKLVLESKNPAAPPAFPNNEPRLIYFQNPHETVTCNIRTLMAALHKVANPPEGQLATKAAADFSTLVRLMRRTSKEDLLSVYGNCKAGAGFQDRQLAKDVFLDSLFESGSADSIAAAVELLKSNEIPPEKIKLWYLSFGFVRHASGSALASALTLLEDPKLPIEAYLGIGALAGHFCREHTCQGVPQVDQLLAKFTDIVGAPAKIPRDKENTVIAALKGLKNIRYLNEETANRLTQIIKDGHVSTRIRVAALETAQSDACTGKLQKGASDIFYNREEDSELRIKAFLVLVECPNAKLANKLSEFLETEPVNQVGAFVTSYLRNLRGSSNPDKEHVREILYNVKPRKKFPFDIRKFSRNHEFSYSFDALSSSAALDSNVIFSQKSYIPRSVNLNLTVEVFGHAFNLLELSGRAENLEKIYERYFGPRGYFNSHKPLEVVKKARHFYKEIEERIDSKYKNMISRGRRSTSERFGSKVKLHNSKLDYNIDVDLSLKVLGNELYWSSIADHQTPFTPNTVVDKVAAFIENGLGKARDYRRDSKNHYNFLDTEVSYPTSTGFPLKLTAFGSGVAYLKVGSNFDASAFLKDPKNGLAKFELIPSASIEIVGEFGVDGYAVESGVKLSGNLHTSTGTEITLKLLNGHGFDLHVGLPVKKSDVVTINTELFSYIREQGNPAIDSPLEFNVPRKDYHGCFDQLQALVGLTFCGDFGFPNDQQSIISSAAQYPLNGNSQLSFRVDKDDETLSTYHMKFFFDIENPKNRRVEFKIDTPGTVKVREVSFLASIATEPEKAIDVQFISPLHRFEARGAIIENDAEYSISGFAKIDEAQEYRARLGLVNGIGAGPSYRPVFELTPASGPLADVRVDGEVLLEKQPGSPRKRFILRGVRLSSPKLTGTVDGSVNIDQNFYDIDLNVGYDQHHVGIKSKYESHGSRKFKIGAEVTPSQYPDFNIGIDYEYNRGDNEVENKLLFIHGRDLSSSPNKLNVYQYIRYHYQNLQNFDFSTKNTISYPLFEVEGKLQGALTRKSLSYDIEGAYGKYRAKSKLHATTQIKELGDYDIDFAVAAFDKELNLQARREIVDPYKSRFTQKLEIKPGKAYDLAAEVTHHFANNEVKFAIIATSTNYPNYALDAGLSTSPAVLNGHLRINDGAKNCVDGVLELSRNPPLHGSFKLFIENQVDSSGEYKFHDSKVNGIFSAHLLRVNNVIKGSADLSKAGDKYTGLIEGSSTIEGQPKWNLRVETDTDLTSKSINSKNRVVASDKHLEVNFHGESQGKETDGTFSGGYEITLPDGKYFSGNVREGLKILPRNTNGELFLEVGYAQQKGGPLSKFHLDTYVKDLDYRRYSIDSKFEVFRECADGNIKFANIFRSIPHDERLVIDQETSLVGSIVKMPLESKAHAIISRPELTFDLSSSCGEYNFKTNGKVLTGIADKVRHLECVTELATPLETLRRAKFENLFHFAEGGEGKPHSIQIKQDYLVNDKVFRAIGDAELHLTHGHLKGSLVLPGYARPSDIDLKYNHESANDIHKAQLSVNANYDNDKNLIVNTNFDYSTNLDTLNGHLTGQSSYEKLRTFDLQFTHKRLSATARNTDFGASVNGEKCEGFIKYDFNPKQYLLDLTANHMYGKSRIFYKLVRKGERQSAAEVQLIWTSNGGGQLDLSANADLESVDNFLFQLKANSEKLKINKLKAEVGNKVVKSGAAKKIIFTAQTADKRGFAGSVTYAVKENEHGFTVEGKGNIEFQNEKLPLTYKGQFRTLTKAADNETGISFTLNADFEKGNFNFEQKMSDSEFLQYSKFCKDGQCCLSEIKNKLQIIDYTELNYDFIVNFQNTFEGYQYDYKAFSHSHRKGLSFDHESGVKLRDSSFNFKSYAHENEGAVIVHLPTREIAAVANYDFPIELVSGKPKTTDLKNVKLLFDGSLFLDRRNKPQEKGNLLVTGEFSASPKHVSSKGEVKVSHPALHKDLIIRGKTSAGLEQRLVDASVDIDIFNRKNQRISASVVVEHLRANDGHNVTGKAELISKGLNLDVGSTGHLFANEHGLSAGSFLYYHDNQNIRKEAGALVEANPHRFFTLVRVPNRELLKVDSVIQGSPQNQVIETEVNLAELRHFTSRVETEGLHSVKAYIGRKDKPNEKVEFTALVTPKLVEFRADKAEGPNKENLVLVVLTAKNNQEAQPDFSINSEKLKGCLEEGKNEVRELSRQVKNLLTDLSKKSAEEYGSLLKGIKKVQPDFKPLIQYFQTEFDSIRKELAEDPQFKHIASAYKNIFSGVVEVAEIYLKKLIELYEKLSHEAADLQVKLLESFKEFQNRFTESYAKLLEPLTELVYQAYDTGCTLAGYGLDFLKQHETEIKHILFGISGYIQEFATICTNTLEQVRQEAITFYRNIVEQVKSLPIYSNFQEKYKEITNVELPQTLKNFYSEFTFAVEDILKTPDVREFYENIFEYLLKVPIPSFFSKLPKIGSVTQVSLLRYLQLLTELPTITEYYYTYRPFINPLDNIPPFKAYGMIQGSHHFFTFDQRHFTFKGTCSYLLAQDFLDGNFSVVANIENSKIKSITVSDHRDTVEMFNDNTVQLNGVHGDYPLDHNDFSGWRLYNTLTVKHKAGVMITKYFKQDIFLIQVSGFYFGRTRGLLGTISNEYYDDYTLPNGHIAKDVNEFANAYKTQDNCPASTEFPPAAGHAPECTKLFSSDSELKAGYNLINPEIYREACDMHVGWVQGDKHSAACDIATAYVLALKQGYMPYATLPEECGTCSIRGQPTPAGQPVNFQSPEGKADVIIVFELSSQNSVIFKELVTPLIASLSQDLREKGIGDTEFALIGYGGEGYSLPVHYGNNGKVTYEGIANQIKFRTQDEPAPTYETLEKKIEAVIRYINTELGREPIVKAMERANYYPFRQGAAKIILLVNSQACPLSPTFPFSLQVPRIFAVRKFYSDLGLQFHFITPMSKSLRLVNKPDSELKNVVGFDQNKIYTFADAKKSDLEGDATDRPHLIYDNDLCLSFSQYNGGAAFNANTFTHAKPEQQKKFVHIVSRRIAKGAVANRYTETCTCKLIHGIYPRPICNVLEKVPA